MVLIVENQIIPNGEYNEWTLVTPPLHDFLGRLTFDLVASTSCEILP